MAYNYTTLSFFQRLIVLIVRNLIRLFGLTWRIEYVHRYGELKDGFMYAFWHRYIIPLSYLYRRRGVGIVISQSRDGEMISQVVEKMGFQPIRGSSSRGGAGALRGIIKFIRKGNPVAITPDGPRGPLYHINPGVVKAAQICNCPVVPVAIFAKPAIKLSSWDKTLIPLPFAKVRVICDLPIKPDDNLQDKLKRSLDFLEQSDFRELI